MPPVPLILPAKVVEFEVPNFKLELCKRIWLPDTPVRSPIVTRPAIGLKSKIAVALERSTLVELGRAGAALILNVPLAMFVVPK